MTKHLVVEYLVIVQLEYALEVRGVYLQGYGKLN